MDSVNGTRAPVTLPRPSSSSSKAPSFPGREDCWSEDATFTLIGAWGERHVILNRGNLRQKHWEEVADAVNGRHFTASNPKSHRTDVQCKNRVDTLKKKYKIEKARVSDSNGAYTSSWPFFSHLDSLIGDKFPKPSPPPPPLSARYRNPPSPPLPWTVPVAPRSATVKRPAPSPATFPAAGGDALPNRNLDFSAFAAVAAAAAAAEAEDSEDSEGSRSESRSRWSMGWCRSKEREREGGYMELALAIERFAEIYERTETTKLRQMEEMEEKRLRTARELDFQRRQHLEEAVRNFKRAKRSPSSDNYL